jgi:hypothetical protein
MPLPSTKTPCKRRTARREPHDRDVHDRNGNRQAASSLLRASTVAADLVALVAEGIVTREERLALFHGFDRVGEILAAEERARSAA